MKKLLAKAMVLFAALALTACGGKSEKTHTHKFDQKTWASNETQHWHPATCEHKNVKGSAANHTFQEVTAEYVAPTCSNPGKKVEVCTVCNYRKETVLTAEHDLQPVAHTQGEGEVAETIGKCSRDNYYESSFNAYDSAATFSVSSDKHSSYVKLSKQGDSASTVEYKFYSPVALKGRFWIDITGNTSNYWDRTSKSGAQALYYTYNDTTTNINTWKNEVKLNGEVVDFENATYKVGSEDIKFGELVYDDFGTLADNSGTPISVPMPEMNLNEGVNTLKFTRLTGYAFNMHKFTFKTILD